MSEETTEDQAPARKGEKGNQQDFAFAFAMGEVKGTVENLRTDLRDFKHDILSSTSEDYKALDQRITKLEHRQVWIAGAAASGGAIITFIAGIILK